MMYNLGTVLQIAIASICFWAALSFAGNEIKGKNKETLMVWFPLCWLLVAIGIDQTYWSMARILVFEEGAWAKWEFEHSFVVVLVKANVLLSLCLFFYMKYKYKCECTQNGK